MAPLEHVVQVEIFGEAYTLRGREDPRYIRKVAQYVDSKFHEIAKGSPHLPSNKMAILASLNIADELIKLLEEQEKAEAKIDELLKLLQGGLGG